MFAKNFIKTIVHSNKAIEIYNDYDTTYFLGV